MSDDSVTKMIMTSGRTFIWHEHYSANADKAIEFYKNVLDFEPSSMDMGPSGQYKMLGKDGNSVAGVLDTGEMNLTDVPPHWAVYISVDDLDARLKLAKEHGAEVIVEPMDVPTVGRMAHIKDPVGAMVWIFKAAPQA